VEGVENVVIKNLMETFEEYRGLILNLIFLLLFLIPAILYIYSLYRGLKIVSMENRKKSPSQAWLLLVPVFNLYWQFVIVGAIGSSFQKEYAKFGEVHPEKPSYKEGRFLAIIMVLWAIPIDSLKRFIWVALVICWIFHWISVTHHISVLKRLAITSPFPPSQNSSAS
jgi:hypothetical protein